MATGETPPSDEQDTADYGSAPAIPTGTLLKDRYLLLRQLNEGGFGAVHLAQDQAMHGRQVVVKIQINQSVDDPWFERKFNEEVRALSMIDHPGVVVAIDSGRTPDGKPFLVMQYVDGVTLRAVMSPEGMPLDRAAGILKQMGHALFAAHEKGIWHRDLKPENLMLQTLSGAGERVRLIDFGIATVADLRNKYQTTTRIAGSFHYMAPEQALGQASAATDIYAMGLIAYEMVTGRKPFIAENSIQLAGLQRDGVRVKPSDLRPSVSLSAQRLILQCLEYDPSKRPRDARAFGDQLAEALLDTDATRITARPVEPKGGRRKAWIATSVFALGLAAAGGVYLGSRNKPEPARKQDAPAKPVAAAQDPAAEQAIELTFWNSVKDSTEPQLYQEYLAKYPQGRFASLANAKIAILTRKVAPAARLQTPPRQDEVEMTFWNSVKDSNEPELYEDYLKKYPNGQFESVARTKLEILNRKAKAKPARNPRGGGPPDLDLGNLAIVNPKMAAEVAEWNALRDVKNPQAYRDFLAKYPNGLFASLAKLKIDGVPGVPPPPPDIPYSGPQQGDLHWSGTIPKHGVVVIQSGKPSVGTLSGELPRVPVELEVATSGINVQEPPMPRNHFGRVILRNNSDSPITDIAIHWKVLSKKPE